MRTHPTDWPTPVRAGVALLAVAAGVTAGEWIVAYNPGWDVLAAFLRAAGLLAALALGWTVVPVAVRAAVTQWLVSPSGRWWSAVALVVALAAVIVASRWVRDDVAGTVVLMLVAAGVLRARLLRVT